MKPNHDCLQFLGRTSHELRDSLAALQLQVDRLDLGDDIPPAKRRDLMSRIRSSIARLDRIAEGMVDFVRAERQR